MWVNKKIFLYHEKKQKYYIEVIIDLELPNNKYLIMLADKSGEFSISINKNMMERNENEL